MTPEPPKSPESRLADAVETLGQAHFAPALADWLGCELGFDNVTLLAYCGHQPPKSLFLRASERRVHARLGSAYLAGAYLLDPFHQLHLDRAEEGLYRLADIAPDHFSRSKYFLTYYQDTTLTDELAYLIRPTPETSITICLGRDASSAGRLGARFGPQDIARAKALAPLCCALGRRQWAGLAASESQPPPDDLPQALRREIATRLQIALTPRQAETAFLVLKGHSSASIALTLGVSAETVKVFRKQLYRKCAISSQAELFSLLLPLLGSLSDR